MYVPTRGRALAGRTSRSAPACPRWASAASTRTSRSSEAPAAPAAARARRAHPRAGRRPAGRRAAAARRRRRRRPCASASPPSLDLRAEAVLRRADRPGRRRWPASCPASRCGPRSSPPTRSDAHRQARPAARPRSTAARPRSFARRTASSCEQPRRPPRRSASCSPARVPGAAAVGAIRRRFAVGRGGLHRGRRCPPAATRSPPRWPSRASSPVRSPRCACCARSASRPTTATGHSLGELTALHWGGALDEAQVLKLAKVRGQVMATASQGNGAMAGLVASPERAEELSAGEDVVIAGYNAPAADGDLRRRRRGRPDLRAGQGRRASTATRINVSHAFHSPPVEPAADAMTERLAELRLRPAGPAGRLHGDRRRAARRREPARAAARPDRAAGPLPRGRRQGRRAQRPGGRGRPRPGAVRPVRGDRAGHAGAGGRHRQRVADRRCCAVVGAAFALGAPVDVDGAVRRPGGPAAAGRRRVQLPGQPVRGRARHRRRARPPNGRGDAPGRRTPTPAPRQRRRRRHATLDLLRKLAAERVELPLETVTADTHPLDDLHLSLDHGRAAGQRRHPRRWACPALEGMPNFATVCLGELAEHDRRAGADARKTGDSPTARARSPASARGCGRSRSTTCPRPRPAGRTSRRRRRPAPGRSSRRPATRWPSRCGPRWPGPASATACCSACPRTADAEPRRAVPRPPAARSWPRPTAPGSSSCSTVSARPAWPGPCGWRTRRRRPRSSTCPTRHRPTRPRSTRPCARWSPRSPRPRTSARSATTPTAPAPCRCCARCWRRAEPGTDAPLDGTRRAAGHRWRQGHHGRVRAGAWPRTPACKLGAARPQRPGDGRRTGREPRPHGRGRHPLPLRARRRHRRRAGRRGGRPRSRPTSARSPAILHGAGRNEPAALFSLTEDRLPPTLAPKIGGLQRGARPRWTRTRSSCWSPSAASSAGPASAARRTTPPRTTG